MSLPNKKDHPETRRAIYFKYNGRCAYCGTELTSSNYTIDHIEPLMRGYKDSELQRYNRERGKNCADNYNPCCMPCNSSKSTLTLEKWREEISKKFDRIQRDCSEYNLLLRFGLVTEHREKVQFYFEKL